MKIKKIEKLNYARFRNFAWNNSMPLFSENVNILFGWNGSGKTTLSKVLRSLETGVLENNCTFKFDTDLSSISNSSNLEMAKENIRVFNGEYVEEILYTSSTIPYIFFAGKDAVNYEKEEEKLIIKKEEFSKIVLPTEHDEIAKRTAIVIKEVAGINSIKKQLTGAGTYASYDKSDFEKRVSDIEKQISNGTIKSHDQLIHSDVDSLKSQLMNTERLVKTDKEISDSAQWLIDNIEEINKTLESRPIQIHSDRIAKLDDKQNGWIEQGVSLHFGSKQPLAKCLFCNSEIKNVDELVKHFSREVVQAISSVDGYLNKIEVYTTSFAKLDTLTQNQQQDVAAIRAIFDKLTILLQEKRNSVSVKKSPFVLDSRKAKSMTVRSAIDATSIAYAIESHFVAQQFMDYKKANNDYEKVKAGKDKLNLEISELDGRVRSLKQQAKNTHEPALALNEIFKVVFPYRKIEITDSDDGTGYILKRDGADCNFSSLSEGEKNFIALAYFVYSLNDTQNKLPENGVAIIDDPVSSLDKQSIFQIFSMLANEIKDHPTRQYFILTHNLDFLGHLKQHFRKGISENKVVLFSFNTTNLGCNIGIINPLLKNHRSDYYYVYSVLAKHKDSCDMSDSHLIVNLLRRWLETFLEFKFSSSGDFQSTLEIAYNEAKKITEKWSSPFSANHLEMYRFINHGSHGFSDPESIDESILNGASERINETFQLVKILDPLHFKKLSRLSN